MERVGTRLVESAWVDKPLQKQIGVAEILWSHLDFGSFDIIQPSRSVDVERSITNQEFCDVIPHKYIYCRSSD